MRGLQDQVRKKNAAIMGRLEEMRDRYEIDSDARVIGLMLGMELVKDKRTKEYGTKAKDAVLLECFKIFCALASSGRSTIRIIPPITISEANLTKGLDILEAAVKKANER